MSHKESAACWESGEGVSSTEAQRFSLLFFFLSVSPLWSRARCEEAGCGGRLAGGSLFTDTIVSIQRETCFRAIRLCVMGGLQEFGSSPKLLEAVRRHCHNDRVTTSQPQRPHHRSHSTHRCSMCNSKWPKHSQSLRRSNNPLKTSRKSALSIRIE